MNSQLHVRNRRLDRSPRKLSTMLAAGCCLLMSTYAQAGLLVGWTTFDPNTGNPNRANDSTPDTQAAGISGLLGSMVDSSASAAGGGQYSAEGEGFAGNATYGSAFAIPAGDQDPGNSGIRLSRFGGNNNTIVVDVQVTNNTGADVTIDGIHFDLQYLFGPVDSTVSVSHFTPQSDLNDAFGFRDLLVQPMPMDDFNWKEFDVSTGDMADVTLANGEKAAFRISMGRTNGVGMKLDNVAISTIPEPASVMLLAGSLVATLAQRRRNR